MKSFNAFLLSGIAFFSMIVLAADDKPKVEKKESLLFRAYSDFGLNLDCEALTVSHPNKVDTYLDSAKANAVEACKKSGYKPEDCAPAKVKLVNLPATSALMPNSCVGWALVVGTSEDGSQGH